VRRLLFGAYAVQALAYLVWRGLFTLNPEHPIYAGIFFVAEAFCIASSLVFYKLIVARGPSPVATPPAEMPTVDVFLCTLNEELDLLRTSAVAARDMQGPHRTWICDDGRRDTVRALAAELGVGYLTREGNEHFKAGNLNNALAATNGELVLVLDADHVARRGMLARLSPLFADPSVALVQTPQVYYNVDSYQHALSSRRLWHEAVLFHHVMQPGASRLNAAFFVGTGAMLRRSALERVGGFATGSITEDIHTSMRLHAAGFRSLYVDEALGFLLAPDTPLAYARQRLRWAQGAMQILRRDHPLRMRGLSGWQKVAYLNSLAGYLAAWQHLIFYLAPGLFALAAFSPIAVDPTLALPVFVAHIAVDLFIYKLLAAPYARLFLGECYKVLSVAIYVRASATLLSPEGLRFRVTPKGRHAGLPLEIVLPAAGLFAFNLTAFGAGVFRLFRGDPHPGALVLATFFAGQFAFASALALVHAWDRRRAHEPYTFPVVLPQPDGAEIRRLSHDTAWLSTPDRPAAGDRVSLDLTLAGVPRPVPGVVQAAAREGGGHVVRVALGPLTGSERDAMDAFFFNNAVPRFLGAFTDAPAGPAPDGEAPPPARRGFLALRGGIL
jgi:cellulose synthase (UDP-forming)